MNRNDVWITGVGLCTPLGNSLADVTEGLLSGRSGISRISSFDAAQFPSQIAAQVFEVPCPAHRDLNEFRQLPLCEQLIEWCCVQALRAAGLWPVAVPQRMGIVMGVGSEWLMAWERDHSTRQGETMRSGVDATRQRLQIAGPALTLGAACASGNFAFALARSWLRSGLVDVCIAGGCDLCVAPLVLAGFGNLRAISRRNDSPQQASRPFDRQRDGFVVGEGGVACIMERATDAKRRGAVGHAEVAGIGITSDAHHMVIPNPDTTQAEIALRNALADARIATQNVDYINAHGTATPVGDICEAKAIRATFGEWTDRVPVSSTKSVTGHMLTAAAAMEAVAGIIAIERNAIPPTMNLDEPDPECRLHHVAHRAIERKVDVIVSNSFGFGGSNTSLVLRRTA